MWKIALPLFVVIFARISVVQRVSAVPCAVRLRCKIVEASQRAKMMENDIVNVTENGIYGATWIGSDFWSNPRRKIVQGLPQVEFDGRRVFRVKHEPAYEVTKGKIHLALKTHRMLEFPTLGTAKWILPEFNNHENRMNHTGNDKPRIKTSDIECRKFLLDFSDDSVVRCAGFLMHLMIADREIVQKMTRSLARVLAQVEKLLSDSAANVGRQMDEEACEIQISKIDAVRYSHELLVTQIWQRLQRRKRDHVRELSYCMASRNYDNPTFFDKWKHACAFYTDDTTLE